MSEKSREEAIVIRQEEIADGVFSMWLKTDEIAKNAKAGQFISCLLYTSPSPRDRG